MVLGLITIFLLMLFWRQKITFIMLVSFENKSAYFSLKHPLFNLNEGKILVIDGYGISLVDKKSIFLKKKFPKEISQKIGVNILKRLDIKDVTILVSGNISDNSYKTAVGLGLIESVLGTISAIFKNCSTIKVEPLMDSGLLTVAIKTKLKISLVDIICSVIDAKQKVKLSEGYVNEKE